MKSNRIANGLGILQLFIGLGAVAGGVGLVLDSTGESFGFPPDMLAGSPFKTFLIPGIVLLVVNGVGSLVGATLTFTRSLHAAVAAMALGDLLVVWIILQVYWLGGFHWLHALYLGLGSVEFALGWLMRRALKREAD